jgi:hypothetical protein
MTSTFRGGGVFNFTAISFSLPLLSLHLCQDLHAVTMNHPLRALFSILLFAQAATAESRFPGANKPIG